MFIRKPFPSHATIRSFIPVILIGLSVSFAHAQTGKPCKAEVRANRGKTLVFANIELTGTEWALWDGMQVKRTGDSIHIQVGNTTITRFQTKNMHVQGNTYQEYYPNGRLKRVDSLSGEGYGHWHEENYFQLATAFVVKTRTYYPDGIPKTLHYYRRFNGKDSLRKTWYPNGTLQQTVWTFPSGTDSATWDWTPEGVLSLIEHEGHRRGYYPSGILQTTYTDTVINEQPLTCKKEYYPGGTLRSVEYTWQEMPYLTWLYYTEDGVLAKKVKHVPPSTHEGWLPEVVMDEVPFLDFVFVDEQPEFPGGNGNLAKYLNEKLVNLVCESTAPLQDTYTVRFMVNREGHVSFQSIQGINADGISENIRHSINNMPRWKPGKVAGRPVNVTFTLKLAVK